MLRHYETTVIFNPELPDESVEELLTKTREVIQKHAGEILHIEHWGRRRMAYEIKKQQRGNYVILAYKAETGISRALEQFFRVTDGVLKFLNIRLEKNGVDALEARIAKAEKERASVEAAAATGTEAGETAAPEPETVEPEAARSTDETGDE